LLTSLSLLGLILTQSYIIMRAFNTVQKQFDHRVDQALDDVIGEFEIYVDTAYYFSDPGKDTTIGTHPENILDIIDTTLLSVLMHKYMDYHRLDDDYVYAIVKTQNDSVLYSSGSFVFGSGRNSVHKACLSCLWKKEYYYLAVLFPQQTNFVFFELILWLILSGLFLLIVIFSYAYTVNTLFRQKKLSEMKNDFINNMTHEFKTPISTISLAAEVLLATDANTSTERIKKYSGIISDENQRMKSQVERVLNMAVNDVAEISLNREKTDIHKLIRNSIHNLCLDHCEKDVNISYELRAKNHVIVVDPMHIRNVIINIVENAIKYSGELPKISISTAKADDKIIISVEDNGIGISNDSMKHIFDRFYRVHTGDIHNVKGFGLGLYYVKSIVNLHGGYIKVKSEINKGSRFDVYLPLVK